MVTACAVAGDLEPEIIFRSLPGSGPNLVDPIVRELQIDTLEALELAAPDGTLEAIEGFGTIRTQMVRTALNERLGRLSPKTGLLGRSIATARAPARCRQRVAGASQGANTPHDRDPDPRNLHQPDHQTALFEPSSFRARDDIARRLYRFRRVVAADPCRDHRISLAHLAAAEVLKRFTMRSKPHASAALLAHACAVEHVSATKHIERTGKRRQHKVLESQASPGQAFATRTDFRAALPSLAQ